MHFQNVLPEPQNKLLVWHLTLPEVPLYLPTKTEHHFHCYLNLLKTQTLCSYCGKTILRLRKHKKSMTCVPVGILTILHTKVEYILRNGSGQKHCMFFARTKKCATLLILSLNIATGY